MGNSKLIKHLSIRVPWHDNGWDGSVCNKPLENDSCLRLKRIALTREDEKEEEVAGKSIEEIEKKYWPACIPERGTFMAPFEFEKDTSHPYANTSKDTHGHLAPTRQRFPAYSAAAIPFRWMMKDMLGSADKLNKETGMKVSQGDGGFVRF